jgi:hypothetical protein
LVSIAYIATEYIIDYLKRYADTQYFITPLPLMTLNILLYTVSRAIAGWLYIQASRHDCRPLRQVVIDTPADYASQRRE